jgi:hypothetical protein
MKVQLIPVSLQSPFPGDETHFPYTFSADYLRHLISHQPARAWWGRSDDGAMIPLIIRKRKSFRIGQLQSSPVRQSNALSPEEELLFLNSLIDELGRTGECDRLVQPTPNSLFQTAPPGAVSCPFGSFRLRLHGRTEDEIFASFHSDYRNKIRAAVRQGAQVRFGRDQFPAFYQLHAATMAQTGMPCESLEAMTRLYDVLAQTDRVLCAVVYFEERPLGGVFVPWTRHSGHYTHGGSGEDVQPAGAVRLLHWEVIRELLRRGVDHYDFVGARLTSVEGTKLEFIQRFKSRFGTQLHEGYLWKYDISPWRSRLYDWLVQLRRALPGGSQPGQGDIIDQEIRKLTDRTPDSTRTA